MKTKLLTLLLFCGCKLISFAQEETLNNYDSNGTKHGKWIVYLNDYWKEVKDSSEASYYKFTYYENGKNIYPMGPRNKKWKLDHSGSNKYMNDKIKLLDGEFSWTDEKGITRGIDIFVNGEYVLYKWYYPSGKINQIFDYTKKWEGEMHTYSVREYNKKGKIKYYFNRKGNNGWMFYVSSEGEME